MHFDETFLIQTQFDPKSMCRKQELPWGLIGIHLCLIVALSMLFVAISHQIVLNQGFVTQNLSGSWTTTVI